MKTLILLTVSLGVLAATSAHATVRYVVRSISSPAQIWGSHARAGGIHFALAALCRGRFTR